MKESEERVGGCATGFRDVLASGKRARLKRVAERPKLGEEEIKSEEFPLSDLRLGIIFAEEEVIRTPSLKEGKEDMESFPFRKKKKFQERKESPSFFCVVSFLRFFSFHRNPSSRTKFCTDGNSRSCCNSRSLDGGGKKMERQGQTTGRSSGRPTV